MRSAAVRGSSVWSERLRRALGLAFIALGGALVSATNLSAAPSVSVENMVRPAPNTPMLLEADQLVYDYDQNRVSAVGNVKIYYGGYTLEAERVTYDRASLRLIATGGVRIFEPNGNVLTADTIDITDDFRDGFVDSLNIETVDRTYFSAERAEREAGEKTTFHRGTYTACEPCRDEPEKPPLWQVKATKIVVDHKEEMVYFNNASLEFLGVPVAWMPVFWTPDPSVKRKTGFLNPRLSYSGTLGAVIGAPYFWAPQPHYDLTLTPTYLTRQGFLGVGEWRHRLQNGQYSVKVAGINQQDGGAFISGTAGSFAQRDWRGGVRTTGQFNLSKFWDFGWDATLTSDRTFTRHYGVLNSDSRFTTSEIHLTGLSERNYFDARVEHFRVLTDSTAVRYSQDRQAIIHPIIDHRKIFDNALLGGQVTLTSNLTSLSRDETDRINLADPGAGFGYNYFASAGTQTRATTQVEWERTMVTPGGVLFTPFAYARGDAYFLEDMDTGTVAGLTGDSTVTRGMAAIGFEARWPVQIATARASHIFEPIVQFIARPNETGAGTLPNEDAQSLVFDDTTLFERDKFSGYDRVEGGTRVNVGLRYVGRTGFGAVFDGLIGQSYHLAGTNSFASPDLATTGAFSGLETKVSDIVARMTLEGPHGHRLTARGRFDEKDFTLNRGELEAAGMLGATSASGGLIYINQSPSTGGSEDVFLARASVATRLSERVRAFGSIAYDIGHNAVAGNSFGIAYDDECLSISLAYNYTYSRYTDLHPEAKQEVFLRVQLRTLGEAGVTPYSETVPTATTLF